MSYRHLPPGRDRMMMYSRYIENRRNAYTNTRSNTHINNLQLSPIRVTRYLSDLIPIRVGYIPLNSAPLIRTIHPEDMALNYNILSNLEDVKIGLINKNLLLNSEISVNKNKNIFCVICQDSITENNLIRTLKCSHSFDLDCIDNWFLSNKKCPICKFEL
jgi:hypothetical protein